jgi:hypothetical protein
MRRRSEEIEKRIMELHPYDCPCIVAWAIEAGHQSYLDCLGRKRLRRGSRSSFAGQGCLLTVTIA